MFFCRLSIFSQSFELSASFFAQKIEKCAKFVYNKEKRPLPAIKYPFESQKEVEL